MEVIKTDQAVSKLFFLKIFCLFVISALTLISFNQETASLIFPHQFTYNIKRAVQLLLFFSTSFILIISNNFRTRCLQGWHSISRPLRYAMCTFFTLGLISTFFASNQAMAALEVMMFLQLTLFCFALASSEASDETFQTVINMVVVIIASLYIFNILLGHPDRLGVVNIRFFAQIQAWTLPLVVIPIINQENKFQRVLMFLAAIIWWSIAIKIASKGMLLSLFVSTFLATLMYQGAMKKWLAYQALCLFGGVFTYLLHLFAYPIAANHITPMSGSIFARYKLWLTCLSHIKEHPLLGIGPMQFANDVTNIASHPHNSVLQIAAEWGMPAALCLLAVFAVGMFRWTKKTTVGNTTIALTIALLTGAIYSLLSGVIVMPFSQLLGALIIGWMIKNHQPESSVKVSPWSHTTFIGILILSASTIALIALPDFSSLQQREIQWLIQHSSNTTFHPRFWAQGYI